MAKSFDSFPAEGITSPRTSRFDGSSLAERNSARPTPESRTDSSIPQSGDAEPGQYGIRTLARHCLEVLVPKQDPSSERCTAYPSVGPGLCPSARTGGDGDFVAGASRRGEWDRRAIAWTRDPEVRQVCRVDDLHVTQFLRITDHFTLHIGSVLDKPALDFVGFRGSRSKYRFCRDNTPDRLACRCITGETESQCAQQIENNGLSVSHKSVLEVALCLGRSRKHRSV
jgi:hypothetical protein